MGRASGPLDLGQLRADCYPVPSQRSLKVATPTHIVARLRDHLPNWKHARNAQLHECDPKKQKQKKC